MKNKIAMLIVAVCICIAPLSYALADQCPVCPKKAMMASQDKMDFDEKFYHKAKFMLANASEVNLSEAQQDKILDLKMRIKKSMIMKDAEIKVLALNIMEELKKDDVNLDIVNTLIDQKYELKKAKAKELAAAFTELCQIPSKEQKTQLKKKWMAKMTEKN